MLSIVQVGGLLLVVVMLVVREILARRPQPDTNPHPDKYKAGDMSVSYWQSEFGRNRDHLRHIHDDIGDMKSILEEIRDELRR